MKKYLASIVIPKSLQNESSGKKAEEIFSNWFNANFQSDKLFRQKADLDFQGIDFIDSKGVKYQIKGSVGRTFTFNCSLDNLEQHLRADVYIFIQIKEEVAYIEHSYNKESILNKANASFNYKKSCFVWAKDLQQYYLDI